MGITQIITDDLTGEPIDGKTKPVKATFNGTSGELYLSDESITALMAFVSGNGAETLTALLAPQPVAKTRKARGTGAASASKTDTGAIREWVRNTSAGKVAAEKAGYDKAGIVTLTGADAKGRLKADLISAYNATQNVAVKPASAPAVAAV